MTNSIRFYWEYYKIVSQPSPFFWPKSPTTISHTWFYSGYQTQSISNAWLEKHLQFPSSAAIGIPSRNSYTCVSQLWSTHYSDQSILFLRIDTHCSIGWILWVITTATLILISQLRIIVWRIIIDLHLHMKMGGY